MKTFVHPPALAVHRYPYRGLFEYLGEVLAGELAPLVGIEDLRPAVLGQSLRQGLRTEVAVQRVRQAPRQHRTRRPVHDCHQILESSLHRDVGDVGAPHLVRPIDPHIPEQIRIDSDVPDQASTFAACGRWPSDPSAASIGESACGQHRSPAAAGDAPSAAIRTKAWTKTARRVDASASDSGCSHPCPCSSARSARC